MLVRYYPRAGAFVTACMTVAMCVPLSGGAAEWSAEPSVRLRREYNDNINLTLQPHNSVNGSIITPKLDFGARAEIWQINATAELSRRRYSGESDLDRDDNTFRLASQYATERDTWRLEGNRTLDSVLSDELTSADIGVVQVQKRRESHGISPSWTRTLTETMQLQLAYQLNDVSYANGQSVGLYDYRYSYTTARLTNYLSEQTQVFVTGGYSAFHVPATGFDSVGRIFQIGIARNFSETLQGSVLAGARRTESLTQGGQPIYTRISTIFGDLLVQTGVTTDVRSEETSATFNGSLDKKFEKSRMNLTLSRSLDPSGSGGQVEQDSLDFRLNHPLTSRFELLFSAYALKSRTLESNISSNDRRYYYVEPGAYWHLSQEWKLSVGYRYTNLRREYEPKDATSNSVYLTLAYYPLKMSISR